MFVGKTVIHCIVYSKTDHRNKLVLGQDWYEIDSVLTCFYLGGYTVNKLPFSHKDDRKR